MTWARWATSVRILVSLGLCSRLRSDVRDRRQTDVRQHHRLMPPPYGGGGVRNNLESEARVYDVTGRSQMRNLEFF